MQLSRFEYKFILDYKRLYQLSELVPEQIKRGPICELRKKCLVRNCVENGDTAWALLACALYIVICAFILVNQRKGTQNLEKEVGLSCTEEQDCQKRLIFQTCRSIHTRKKLYLIYVDRQIETFMWSQPTMTLSLCKFSNSNGLTSSSFLFFFSFFFFF